MELTDLQKTSVRNWAAEGASLSEIQTRLTEEFDLRLSFMDVRLLMLDLEVELQDRQDSFTRKKPDDDDDDFAADSADDGDLAEESRSGSGVKVELSRLAEPGLALNGFVTFSDGVKAKWGLTAHGELTLAPENPSYRPSAADVKSFQVELQRLIGGGQGY